jgi:biotin synthase-related radical SAM superfamily protein
LCGQATPAASQRKILFKSTKKVIPVAVIKKNIFAIQTPGDDMMNRTVCVEACHHDRN